MLFVMWSQLFNQLAHGTYLLCLLEFIKDEEVLESVESLLNVTSLSSGRSDTNV